MKKTRARKSIHIRLMYSSMLSHNSSPEKFRCCNCRTLQEEDLPDLILLDFDSFPAVFHLKNIPEAMYAIMSSIISRFQYFQEIVRSCYAVRRMQSYDLAGSLQSQ